MAWRHTCGRTQNREILKIGWLWILFIWPTGLWNHIIIIIITRSHLHHGVCLFYLLYLLYKLTKVLTFPHSKQRVRVIQILLICSSCI